MAQLHTVPQSTFAANTNKRNAIEGLVCLFCTHVWVQVHQVERRAQLHIIPQLTFAAVTNKGGYMQVSACFVLTSGSRSTKWKCVPNCTS
jgi:hypothetical protein